MGGFGIDRYISAACLAQLAERQSAVREVEGSRRVQAPYWTKTQGLKIAEKNVLPL